MWSLPNNSSLSFILQLKKVEGLKGRISNYFLKITHLHKGLCGRLVGVMCPGLPHVLWSFVRRLLDPFYYTGQTDGHLRSHYLLNKKRAGIIMSAQKIADVAFLAPLIF